jgi:hypothetical protein
MRLAIDNLGQSRRENGMTRLTPQQGSALIAALLCCSLAHAKVSEEEAARLNGKDLTPLGGEVAGNADGTIPAWTGKWRGVPPGVDYPSPTAKRKSPYADEKSLFSITPDNYKEHVERLSEGQIALFERFPTFRMDIYPSHRDFTYPDEAIEKARYNATHTVLSNGVESVTDYTGGLAFPIPQGPEEVMWNTRTNTCHRSVSGPYDGYGVFSNGERAHDAVFFRQAFPFNEPGTPIPTTEKQVGDRVVYTLTERLAPPRTKGQITAVQDPLDYKKNKRNAWQYDPGTRRVRKAPAIGYDNPDGPGGLQTIDDHKGFNGAFDRFTYQLLGKREVYIPYHNYEFNDPAFGDLDSRLTVNHLNPDHVRFELHRAWLVEAQLAPGKRHAYKKRRWYVDEDSWNPVMSENFDSRDNLWRVGFFLSDYQYDAECYVKHTQVFHDLPSGAYVSNFITIDRDEFDYTIPFMEANNFTPAALRREAKR